MSLSAIGDSKDIEQDLLASEAPLLAAFDSSPVGMIIATPDRRVLRANAAAQKLSGFSAEELLGRAEADSAYPDDLRVGADLYAALLDGARSSFQIEKRYVRKGGQVFWARVTVSAVRDDHGQPHQLLIMIEDIDEQKRMLATLQESEARFRAMFDNIPVGMALMSLDRHVLAVNQTIADICGYPVDELRGLNPSDLSYPEDRAIGAQEYQEMVAGRRDSMRMEKRYVRKNGEVFWARICYSVVRDSSGQPEYLVGSMEDITETRLAAERLAAQQAESRRTLEQHVEARTHELEAANQRLLDEIDQRKRAEEALSAKAAEEAITAERTRLARDLHDAVTQTLFAASLIAEVLPDLWELDPAEARSSTEELRQLTRGALAEMRTLLLELRPAALLQSRLGDLIRQLCEALIGRARLPIELDIQGDRSLPPEVQVAFYRIAQESLNNAAKYAHATRIYVGLILSPAGAHFSICDNGVGFDPGTKKSTSLGLRIMRERAEAIGANLAISSEPGHGVCIEVEWIEKPDMKLSVFKT